MKTMMELLIRVQQLRDCCLRTANNPQLTQAEKNSTRHFKLLVRGCLPPQILRNYDQLKQTDPELLNSPEIFAMAVLVDTYRNSTPAGRKKLLAHFATPQRRMVWQTRGGTAAPAGREPRKPCRQGPHCASRARGAQISGRWNQSMILT